MTELQVVELMNTSRSEAEWNKNCDAVKKAFDGYPAFWFSKIVVSGLASRVAATWGGSAEIQIIGLDSLSFGDE
jgi:hypothetical protein